MARAGEEERWELIVSWAAAEEEVDVVRLWERPLVPLVMIGNSSIAFSLGSGGMRLQRSRREPTAFSRFKV